MDSIALREIAALKFVDAEHVLKEFRAIEASFDFSGLPTKVRTLRTASLKEAREAREAALFCFMMSQRLGTKVYIHIREASDYDAIGAFTVDSVTHYCRIQIKEVVPFDLPSVATLQEIIDDLPRRYPASPELTVVIHLNRHGRFELDTLTIPQMSLGALWVICSTSRDANEWMLWGNLLHEPFGTCHRYPGT